MAANNNSIQEITIYHMGWFAIYMPIYLAFMRLDREKSCKNKKESNNCCGCNTCKLNDVIPNDKITGINNISFEFVTCDTDKEVIEKLKGHEEGPAIAIGQPIDKYLDSDLEHIVIINRLPVFAVCNFGIESKQGKPEEQRLPHELAWLKGGSLQESAKKSKHIYTYKEGSTLYDFVSKLFGKENIQPYDNENKFEDVLTKNEKVLAFTVDAASMVKLLSGNNSYRLVYTGSPEISNFTSLIYKGNSNYSDHIDTVVKCIEHSIECLYNQSAKNSKGLSDIIGSLVDCIKKYGANVQKRDWEISWRYLATLRIYTFDVRQYAQKWQKWSMKFAKLFPHDNNDKIKQKSDRRLLEKLEKFNNDLDSEEHEPELKESFCNQTTAVSKYIERSRRFAVKSAIVVIMSRNGSHNIGSHVINRVVKAISTSNIQDHKFFFRYLQQRMDFLAQISTTDSKRPSTNHWFAKEIMKGLYEQHHLLDFIARSEGLKGYDDDASNNNAVGPQCIIKQIKNCTCRPGCTTRDSCEGNCEPPCLRDKQVLVCSVADGHGSCKPDLTKDVMVAVPGGSIGFHALYTIIENFTRNTAKHCFATHPKKNRDMNIRVEIWDCPDHPEYHTIRIWDNYSFVSGLINHNTHEINSRIKENDNNELGIDNKPVEIKNINEIAVKDVKQNNKFYFLLIPSCEKDEQDNKIEHIGTLAKYENVRFIEDDYWQNFEDKNKNNGADYNKKLKIFLERYLIPSHVKINKNICDSIIKDNGEISEGNWGIGEIKITAGYLAGRDTSEIGGGGEDNLKNLVRAIPVPEYSRNEDGEAKGLVAYRLGYEFRMRKPVDLLVVGPQSWNVVDAERYGVVHRDAFDPSRNARMVLLDQRNSENGKRDDFLNLLGELQGNHAEENINEQLKKEIERFGSFVVFVVGGEMKKAPPSLKKRIVFVSQKETDEHYQKSADEIKIWLYRQYINHLLKIKGLDKLHLVFNTAAGEDSMDGSLGRHLTSMIARDIIDKSIPVKSRKKLIEIINKSNASTPGSLANSLTASINKLNNKEETLKKSLEDIRYKLREYSCFDTVKTFAKKKGFFDTSYVPPTVPRAFRGGDTVAGTQNGTVFNEDSDYFEHVIISRSVEETAGSGTGDEGYKAPPTILYERHMQEETKNKKFLYSEDLSGAAPHFPQLASPPQADTNNIGYANRHFFYGQLIETGLLKIAIADERVFESVVMHGSGLAQLRAAGVCFVRKMISYELGESDYYLREEGIFDIEENSDTEIDADILIIHQGILDKLKQKDEAFDVDQFISKLKDRGPYVLVTSGRGEPENLPDGVKFVPFSVVEGTILARPHSKYNLVRQIL